MYFEQCAQVEGAGREQAVGERHDHGPPKHQKKRASGRVFRFWERAKDVKVELGIAPRQAGIGFRRASR
jgi:hypothetical protein